ncbi:Rare lipoprotein A precursor [Thioalkalivibrio nitratireducens DSM 14787]|uniref:Endolytic peptidoglycan transglycosylase RlpA n=1 Tax=Thioalkalivibrio nitratireducens (strain DSM 14787 / UNIQEM 213 / ALEN2) TaxID=1255043 RepID=L0E204_THIND|nr:septal ring lytic transglycosylase RlpA family protein [Thioalkalivibrio nitratireducens]AGA34676.1 Rare lipoprotein A precursor [Thioalkalivibrio nitratireducens DSM 14787]
MRRSTLAVGVLALVLLAVPPATSADVSSGYTEAGIASYYHDRFQGRKTASGERFDQREFSAAHRSLPFGTTVRVTRNDTGQSIVVRINDRGPFRRGRIIDLSREAARELGMLERGLVRVTIEVISPAVRKA